MRTQAFISPKQGRVEDGWIQANAEIDAGDVRIAVTHCAVGRGDVEFIDRGFNTVWSNDIVVPGHEVVGMVSACGSGVTSVQIGDRVGAGYQAWSCGICPWCERDIPQYCRQQQCLIVHRPGGFSSHVDVNERFVVPIPSEIPSPQAAPLLCAGLTAFSAINAGGIEAGMVVAVVGIGGIGHFAAQFLHAFGCVVTGVSNKQLDTSAQRQLGINALLDPREFATSSQNDRFDRVFVTTGMQQDGDTLLSALTPNGKVIYLGSPIDQVSFPIFRLNDFSGRSIVGSYIGSPPEAQHMLYLAIEYGIRAQVQVLPFESVARAIDIVRSGHALFRVVLERSSGDPFRNVR